MLIPIPENDDDDKAELTAAGNQKALFYRSNQFLKQSINPE